MRNITIKFSDGERNYNQQLIRNMLKQGKSFEKRFDIENLVSKIHERIKKINLKPIPEKRFYREIQYELAERGYLETAELYRCIADSVEDRR